MWENNRKKRLIIARLKALLLGCFIIQAQVFADVTHYETSSYKEIARFYQKQMRHPKQTLLVFDIDNTLLTMTQPLGGVGWWDWQFDLLQHNINAPELFAQTADELQNIQGLLFQLIQMEPTDSEIKPFLNTATHQGSTLLALTARSNVFSNITLTQLQKNGFVDADNQLIFNTNGLRLHNHKTSAAGNFNCQSLTKTASYQQGVMFLDGDNKGLALQCLLQRSDQKYTHVLVVDDSQHNLDAIKDVFLKQADLQIITVLYNREHAKEAQFRSNTTLQTQAYQQWMNIKRSLHENITKPNY